MKKILGTHGIGKSSQLISFAKESDIHFIICKHPHKHLQRALNLGITDITFLGYEDIEAIQEMTRSGEEFLVDNLDKFLEYIQPNLKGFSLNID